MSDLISRKLAIDALYAFWSGSSFDGEGYDIADKSEDVLSELPSAETEIIMCKDCKYWTHIKRTNRYWCKTDEGLYDLNPSPDDFCSRAERREDNVNEELGKE